MSFFSRPSFDDLAIVLVASAVFFVSRLLSGDDLPPDAQVTATASTATATTVASGDAVPQTVDRDVDACDFRDEIERVRRATVRVVVEWADGQRGSGTGFHLGDGLFVSAAHVVTDEAGGPARGIVIQSAATGEQYSAQIESVGATSSEGWGRDMATLRAVAIPDALEWRAPAEADVDEDVRVLGYPWSQEDDGPTLPPPLVVRGTLAFLGSVEGIEVVQSSARAEEGMSGGPLVDECGTAVAVVTGARFQENELGALREGFGVFVSMSEFERLP